MLSPGMTDLFTDTHCHLDFEDYDSDRLAILERARANGLAFLINPGIDLPSSAQALQLAMQFPGYVYAAAGIHPNYSYLWDDQTENVLRELASAQGLVAIGEIGLDYYRDYAAPALQRQVFQKQLDLAASLRLPVIIHNREASADLLPMLKDWQHALPADHPQKLRPGVLHSYSGSLADAESLLECGFFFGIGGPITYKNAHEKHQVTAALPLESLLLETDAPFLTPHPHRGKRNEPAYIPLIASAIAELKQIDPAEVGTVTTRSARLLFSIPEA